MVIKDDDTPGAITRRDFIKKGAAGTASLAILGGMNSPASSGFNSVNNKILSENFLPSAEDELDLTPAKWIWYPSQRTLQNTFILFRKEIIISKLPVKASGWIAADSRYLLSINGKREQWGPAPSDPRWYEADPLDLTGKLNIGENIIAATVLFYGQGDGTWPIGKPGFIFYLNLEYGDGTSELITSGASWKAHLCRAWQPGHYKRWYLRALQEEFDARKYPYGWDLPGYALDDSWLPAMAFNAPVNDPPSCSYYNEYMMEIWGNRAVSQLRRRSIPMLNEYDVPVLKLSETHLIKWHRPPEEYFEFLTPNMFEDKGSLSGIKENARSWEFDLANATAAALTFEFEEQIVGWPHFTIEAPEGTIIEMMTHESHEAGASVLLNTHFHSWTRFICKEDVNKFETFDFESLRWMQLHIRGSEGKVKLSGLGVRRRVYPWPNSAEIKCSDAKLQKLAAASINTLYNCAQETLVDGMGRERQQYSGDGSHQMHAIFSAFGEKDLPRRFINTFSQGITQEGYFLDCWPAYDRLARLMERQLQLTDWGPLIDHGIGFNFDCYNYYLYTGDLNGLKEAYPRLKKFNAYLPSLLREDGLLAVEDIGVPSVYIDHQAYTKRKHKQCAFNLYAAAMLENAFAPLCAAHGESELEDNARKFSKKLLKAAVQKYWSAERGLFVDNLPWLSEEGSIRVSDRTLATAVLFNQCPRGDIKDSLKALAGCPPEMGLSYPANAGWRLWAMCKGGMGAEVIVDLRERWSRMRSVNENNTLQEFWDAEPDFDALWSHCAVVPLYMLYMGIAGVNPVKPGYAGYSVFPQLGDIEELSLTIRTVKGDIRFNSNGPKGNRVIKFNTLKDCEGELKIDAREKHTRFRLKRIEGAYNVYYLPENSEVVIETKYT